MIRKKCSYESKKKTVRGINNTSEYIILQKATKIQRLSQRGTQELHIQYASRSGLCEIMEVLLNYPAAVPRKKKKIL